MHLFDKLLSFQIQLALQNVQLNTDNYKILVFVTSQHLSGSYIFSLVV